MTAAWSQAVEAEGKLRILADVNAELTRALGFDYDCTPNLGGIRCRRFSAIVDDSEIKILNLEPEESKGGLTCTLAPNLLSMV